MTLRHFINQFIITIIIIIKRGVKFSDSRILTHFDRILMPTTWRRGFMLNSVKMTPDENLQFPLLKSHFTVSFAYVNCSNNNMNA